ncbi:hypothetical protein ACGE0T_11805 [Parabacteroides sp. APC149_11_2_Y6]
MMENARKEGLNEVYIIRPILILCIVIGHSFAIYSGAWENVEALTENVPLVYKWLNPFFISFTLQAFVVISGYLFAYQYLTLNRKYVFF